jgi:hypothetical protein
MTDTKKQGEPGREQQRCHCGALLKKADPKEPSSAYVCPTCGAELSSDMSEELSAADTQMLNIKEMARMAQEGVDPSAVSGEWVTPLDFPPEKDEESEDKD